MDLESFVVTKVGLEIKVCRFQSWFIKLASIALVLCCETY